MEDDDVMTWDDFKVEVKYYLGLFKDFDFVTAVVLLIGVIYLYITQ